MFNSTEEITAIEIRRHQPRSPWTYESLDQRQREIAARVEAGGKGALLLSELSPTITYGRRTPPEDLLFSEEYLKTRGIDLYPTDRGGLATYHGPGQWVLFPVNRLDVLTGDRRGVRKAVETLLEIAWVVGKAYHPKAEIRDGKEMGVWTPRGKFAAAGIHVHRGVLLHGIAINGFQTETSFAGLRPCGLDAPVDFLLPTASEEEFQTLARRLISETLHRFWGLAKISEQRLTAPKDNAINADDSTQFVGA